MNRTLFSVVEKEVAGLHVKLDVMMVTLNDMKSLIGRRRLSEESTNGEQENIFPFSDVEQILGFEQRLQNHEFLRKMVFL